MPWRIGTRSRYLGLVLAGCLPSPGSAQDLEPRSYSNIPLGLNFLVVGYAYSSGGVVTDSSLPLENGKVELKSIVSAYARSFELGGQLGKFDVILPYASASGSATFQDQFYAHEVKGLADPQFRVALNLYGAPALTPAHYAGYEQDLILGVSLAVRAPIGKYDPDRLLNIGNNRWSGKLEFGASKAFEDLTLELATGITVYGDNDDYFRQQHLEQDSIRSVQGHIIYSMTPMFWLALDGTYYTGGRTTVDGVERNDLQKNTRYGITASYAINRHHSLKFNASTGVVTRIGNDFDLFTLAWQYRWGEGF